MELSEVRVWAAERREKLFLVLSVVLLVGIGAVAVAGQTGDVETFSDTFEDGDVDGWDGYDQYPQISTESVSGSYSLYTQSNSDVGGAGTVVWSDGPRLDTSEEFTVEFVMRHNYVESASAEVRAGIASPDTNAVGENAFIMFDGQDNVTYLSTWGNRDTPSNSSDTISDSFENSWVSVELYSSGNGTVQAKVWEYGASEPSGYQLAQNFSGVVGQFSVDTGNVAVREVWLDEVVITGRRAPAQKSDDLDLAVRRYMEPNASYPVHVYYTPNNSTPRMDVTDSAMIDVGRETVGGEQVLELVNTSDGWRVNTTGNATVAEEVRVSASYTTLVNGSNETFVEQQDVVVAAPTVGNLKILPGGLIRTQAVLTDSTLQALLVAALLSVPAARFTNAFAGLATAEIVVAIGWLAGYITLGIAMLSVFMAMFVGLNLAANIDYAISRGR